MSVTNDVNCAYCAEGDLVNKFGIKIRELPASKVYLFREQSHRGRVIVASKFHVGEIIDLKPSDRRAFMDDVASVSSAIHRLFHPKKVNYGAYGDTCGHLHFHLVPKYEDDQFEWGDTFAMNPQRKFLTDGEYAELVAKISAGLLVSEGSDLHGAFERLRREIAGDGRIDFGESLLMLEVLKPYVESSATISSIVAELEKIREDGVVTDGESSRIISLLDDLVV